jgi:hypothetical protein
VAYNPAGILAGPKGQFLLSLGAAQQGFDQIANSFSKVNDPAQFMIDNFGTNLDANGSISGILGFNFGKVGVSLLLPSVTARLSKPPASLVGQVTAMASSALVVTLGRSFALPVLPAGVDVGLNVKALNGGFGQLTISGNPTPGSDVTATQIVAQGSGTGFDIGARAYIEIPMVTDFSVGIAMRDLSESISYKPKTRTDTYSVIVAGGTPTVTKGVEIEGAQATDNMPTTTAIGASGTIPGVGLKVALDLDSISGGSGIFAAASETVTSIGLEYPLMMGLVLLRAGTSSSPSISRTTIGAKINIPILTLEIASVMDSKNSKNNAAVIDIGAAF